MEEADMKRANISFHCSERLKSNIIVAGRSLDTVMSLEPREIEGGRRVVIDVLDTIIGEINIAKTCSPSWRLNSAERKIMETMGNVRLSEFGKAKLSLAEALSQITSMSSEYIKPLMDRNLI